MNETSKCPQCGKPVPDSAPGGLCPECMLKVGAAAPTEDVGPNGTIVIQPSPRTPLSVEEIAKYFPQLEILECMGRGGMGVVYKARHPKLDRFVALKILAPEKEGDPKFAERFEREARALARLNHPNIVAVHDFGESDGLFYLIMEFVDGTNLRRLIQERRINPEQALAIVPSICEALQYAHGKGIVHRDIKPENVLLAKDGEVKIADFGIAKILRSEDGQPSLTEDGTLGTPHYMAPEQVETPKKVDHRADIYSLGVVFYEMLTGELPLGKFAPPSRKVQVDVRLDEVVLHALEKEPDRRYQQAGQIKSDVETISTSPLKSEGRNSKSEERASSSSLIEVARRQVSGPGIGLIICGILNWVCLPLSLLVVAKFFNHGGSPAWIAMSGLGILVGLLPLLLGGFMIYAGLMMRRLKHYPAAIVASVGAMLFTPGNLIGLPIGIWALVVLCGKDVRAVFRAVREGASLPSSPVQLEKAGGRSGIGWLTAGIVVLVLGVPLIALLFLGGLAGLYSLQAMRAPEVVRTVESSHPLFVTVQELSFGPIQERVLHQRHDGTTNWFLDLETGNVLMPPPELAESLVRQELTSVPGTRAMQFADWVKRTGVDLAVYGPDAFAALGGTWKPTHGATYEDWDDLDAQTPAQLLTSIRAEARKPSWHGRQEIHGVGPRSVLFRDFSVNYFFRTRDGALGVLQVVGRDEASGGLKLRYKLAEASGSSAAPQPKALESGRSFGLEREVILNDADASAEALDFETGRVLVVPEEARRQLLATNADWFVNSGVDLLTETTQKGVGLITVRTNALTLVKLASEEWHGLTPAQLTEALGRGMSGLPEAETHFTKVYLLHTNTPTPVTLGFRTGSGAEGVMQASWPAGEQHPAITLRYKLAEASPPSGAAQAKVPEAERSFSPVITHTLQDMETSRTKSLLDLDMGECVEAPEMFPVGDEWDSERVDQWLIENGVDLAVGVERREAEETWGFGTSIAGAPIVIPVSEGLWNTVDPDSVLRELDSGRTSAWDATEEDRFYLLHFDPEPSFPLTYAFRTQEGTAGLIQVTGFAPGREGIEVRLKHIRSRNNRLEPISGWATAGSRPQDYEMGRDRTTTHSGKASAHIRTIVSQPSGFGTLMQSFAADAYQGQRVRLSGFLQTMEVGSWAGLWMRVDGPDGTTLAFDNMQDRPVTGTTGWTLCEIVLDVPEESKLISIGLLLSGAGQVWMDDLKFEEVGKDVDTTGTGLKNIGGTMPQLDFED